MTTRAGLAAVALCAAALACDRRGEPPAAPGAATSRDGAAPPAAGQPPAGPARGAAPASPPRRGDRHARAAAGRAHPVREVLGTIVRADGGGEIAVRPGDGREIRLRIGPGTAVRGAGGGKAALGVGDEVRASWRSGEGDPPTALSVEVRAHDPWTDRG